MSDPTLDVVIVSYECRELLRDCLQSLAEHPPARAAMSVHVVDNASTDGTADMVRAQFTGVRLDALPVNAGFSAANNRVLQRSTASYVLLLNPDTQVTAGALDHMLTVMADHPDAGMAGCRLVLPDGSFDHAAKRSFPTPLSALAHFTGVGRLPIASARLAQYRAPELGERERGEVEAINGAFMLVRSAAIAEVGLLDEGYWLYMEDLDWCWRFARRGWRVLYDGSVDVVHVKGGTAGAHRAARQNVAFHRGMGRFYRKVHGDGRPLAAAAVYLGIGAKLAVSLVRSAGARRRRA
jgi:GT2 family glycosyltransferase